MEERSIIAYEHYREALQKFDYFVTGLIGALCAYIGQTIHPQKIGFTANTLELLAFLILILSFFLCFKRIEKTIMVFNFGHKSHHFAELRGQLMQHLREQQIMYTVSGETLTKEVIKKQIDEIDRSIPEINDKLEKAKNATKKYYDYRNLLIFIGFVLIVVSKIWSAYS